MVPEGQSLTMGSNNHRNTKNVENRFAEHKKLGRIGLVITVLLVGVICVSSNKPIPVAPSEPEGKPNILIINVDDLGFHDLSCYGSEIYETPNMDKLAAQSYTFHNAYANYPRCLPSRYALMTATYPVQEFDIDLSKTPEKNNFIKQFDKAGYQSYYVGKWHLGEGENTPKGFGFDDSFAANGAGGVASHFYPFNTRKIVAPIGEVPPVTDVMEKGKDGDYLADLLTDQMIEFIKSRNTSAPFFAMLCPYAVHTPFEAKQEDIERNAEQIRNFDYGNTPEYVKEGNGFTKMRQNDSIYAAMVENMDWNLGRLMEALDTSGLSENTILVFTSDHGGLSNKGNRDRRLATTNFPLRAGKGHLYEGGVRVPLMIRWPNHIQVNKDSESIVALMDLMPTLLDLSVDAQLASVDGKSFEKVLNSEEKWNERTLVFYEKMARPTMTGDFPGMAMRSGNYKLFHYFDTDTYELYDLSSDPGEEQNIAATHPEIVSSLKKDMETWKENHLTQ